jgi:hypothetical protein
MINYDFFGLSGTTQRMSVRTAYFSEAPPSLASLKQTVSMALD